MKIETFKREIKGKVLTSVAVSIDTENPPFCCTIEGTGPDVEMTGMIRAVGLANQHRINLYGLRYLPLKRSMTVFGCPHCTKAAVAQETIYGKIITKFLCGTRAVSDFVTEPMKPITEPEVFPEVVDQKPLEEYRFSPREGVITIRTAHCMIHDLAKTRDRLFKTVVRENKLVEAIEKIQNVVDGF